MDISYFSLYFTNSSLAIEGCILKAARLPELLEAMSWKQPDCLRCGRLYLGSSLSLFDYSDSTLQGVGCGDGVDA